MLRSIQWRIAIPFVLLIIVSLGILGGYIVGIVRDTQTANLRSQLATDARLVAQHTRVILPDSRYQLTDAVRTLGEETKAAEAAGVDMLHLDVMDGHFVPNITIGPAVVEAIRKITDIPLDVHLMIEEPDKFLGEFIRAGANYLTVHVEATVHLHRTVHWIRESGVKAGVSLNPATPL